MGSPSNRVRVLARGSVREGLEFEDEVAARLLGG